jgi:hypothetical protein
MDPKLLLPGNPLAIRVVDTTSRKSRNRMRLDRLARANALQPVIYQANLGAANNDRQRSPAVWYDCPWNQIQEGSIAGIAHFNDFDNPYLTTPTTQAVWPPYKGFSSTGGTITKANPQLRYGVITLGSDGDDEGASIAQVGTPFQVSALEGQFWAEFRVKVDTIAVTQYDAFVGFAEGLTLTATVPITATAGAMADQNMFGFLRPGTSTTGDGSLLRTFYKANGVTAVTVADYAAQFVADTYIKLGIRFSPADKYLRFFVNNIELATKKLIPDNTGTDFPADVTMGAIAAVLNTSAITSVFSIDWWRYAQMDSGFYPGA